MRILTLLLAALLLAPLRAQEIVEEPQRPFDAWLADLIADAKSRGFDDALLNDTLAGLQPLPRVVERDRAQAELTLTLDRYYRTRITPRIVRLGRQHATSERTILKNVQTAYGVPPSIVLAIWGIESHYGTFNGATPVFQSLATLAWQPRRSDFFRGELFKALTIVSGGYIDAKSMTGSWAGAMGQPQFMPSSYLEHAVDFDRDGLRDIWKSRPDTLASIASYLKGSGWMAGATWGREVAVGESARAKIRDIPMRADGCSAKRAMTERRPLTTWQTLGVRLKGGGNLPVSEIPAALVDTGGRSFVVYPNYDALLGYNCAHLYALSVGMLSDALR